MVNDGSICSKSGTSALMRRESLTRFRASSGAILYSSLLCPIQVPPPALKARRCSPCPCKAHLQRPPKKIHVKSREQHRKIRKIESRSFSWQVRTVRRHVLRHVETCPQDMSRPGRLKRLKSRIVWLNHKLDLELSRGQRTRFQCRQINNAGAL